MCVKLVIEKLTSSHLRNWPFILPHPGQWALQSFIGDETHFSIDSCKPIFYFCRWFAFWVLSPHKSTCFYIALVFWGTFFKSSCFSLSYSSHRVWLFFEKKTNNSLIFNSHSVDLLASSQPFSCLQFFSKLRLFFFLY